MGAPSSTDPLTRFKHEQLGCIVMDEPWDTALMYGDAQTDLPEIDEADRDRAVGDVLLQLYDEGLVCFFEVTEFGGHYTRTPTEEAKLSREALVRNVEPGRVDAPVL